MALAFLDSIRARFPRAGPVADPVPPDELPGLLTGPRGPSPATRSLHTEHDPVRPASGGGGGGGCNAYPLPVRNTTASPEEPAVRSGPAPRSAARSPRPRVGPGHCLALVRTLPA
ncbi:hypothetical protein GCM10023082_44060 [Streptomyces tremellae]|uniref:Uncharacterized protein n=1 Tax=Streptomyces tremellae TaxID=1124239 RepID=A0ABP7FNA5_9ACTN